MTPQQPRTNPWTDLRSEAPYVSENDRHLVDRVNNRPSTVNALMTDVPPDPYVGNPKEAKIIFLARNPGYTAREPDFLRDNPWAKPIMMGNLTHQVKDFPLFYLDDRFYESPGYAWWHRILSFVLRKFPNEKAKVSKAICEILFAPYHSASYRSIGLTLPTQYYSFDLVTEAIEKKKMIIVMRILDSWLDAVPKLADADYHVLSSNQNITVSPKNLGEEGFACLCNIIARRD